MLNAFEKIVTGIAILCVAVTLIPYLWWGTPSTRATEFIPKVTLVSNPKPAGKTSGETATPRPKDLTQSDKEIIDALKNQGTRVRNSKVTRQTYDIPDQLFEEVSKTANWTKQLKTAHSQVLPNAKNGQTRLKIFNISRDSYLRKFGMEDNDIIELIDGDMMTFSEDSSTALYGVFREKLDRLRNGDAISLTVSRNGTPLHLEFKLPK